MDKKQMVDFRNLFFLSGAIVLLMFVISSYVWAQIPSGSEVCISWNAGGECVAFGNKLVAIYLVPIITAVVVGLFPLVLRFEARPANVRASHKALVTIGTTMLLFTLVLHIVLLREIMGRIGGIGTYWPILAGLVLVVLGNYLGKIQRNDFIGIRTPWTMASEQSWNKTHRLGGKLMVLLGILFVAGTIVFKGDGWFYFLLGGALLLVLIVTVYSYFIWKSDTDMHPA